MVRSVLGNLPTYYPSLFVAPEGVLETLQKICRQFLWGSTEGKRKIYWKSWDNITASKENGGLGVGSIKSLNISLIVKWLWRLHSDPQALWAKAIHAMHNLQFKPDHHYVSKLLPGTWKNIVGVCNDLRKKDIPIENVLSKQLTSTGVSWKCSLTNDGSYEVGALRKKMGFQPCD